MLPTPSTTHINPARIYSPAEDSYLLLDTLSFPSETQFLTQRFGNPAQGTLAHATPTQAQDPQGAAPTPKPSPTPLILEVGTGSGVVLAFIAAHARSIFGRGDVLVLGTDVNGWACEAAGWTVVQALSEQSRDDTGMQKSGDASTLLGMVCADLTSPIRDGMVDVLVFNPPYVPSEDVPEVRDVAASNDTKSSTRSYEHDSQLLSLSYEGGVDGMEVTNRLLEQLLEVLNPERGVAYILLCQQNKPEEVMRQIRGWGQGWCVCVVGRSGMQAGWEKLLVIRICRC